MEILLIDILSMPSIVLYNKNSEAFFIFLSLVKKSEEMVINLPNKLFSHLFITNGKFSPNNNSSANTACEIIDTNFFAYIATNQYLSDKHYRIMIVTDASKHFTVD